MSSKVAGVPARGQATDDAKRGRGPARPGRNDPRGEERGTANAAELATYVVEKGKPLIGLEGRKVAGINHAARPAEADRCRRSQCRIRRSRPRQWACGPPPARLALRHSQLRRCGAFAGVGRLSGDRPVSAWLWHDALSLERHGAERPAIGARRRCHCLDGCAQDREGDGRRF